MTSKNSSSSNPTEWYNYKEGYLMPAHIVAPSHLTTTTSPTAQQITYGNDGYQVESLKERMGLLESAMIRWEERYEKKLREHEETIDSLLEALKNATK